MRAAIFKGPRSIKAGERPDPAIFKGPRSIKAGERPDPAIIEPTDTIVRVLLACVCGSDLWYHRGESPHAVGSIGHEFIGIVDEIGPEVSDSVGDLVIAPFLYSDGTCPHSRAGAILSCLSGGSFGEGENDGGQGEAVRVPLASSTLVTVPGSGHSDETLCSLLALSDVMSTGRHAAVSAGVGPGSTVAVVGDGAVGLCAVLASTRLGAERIITLSRQPSRQVIALQFGASDIISDRGYAANKAILDYGIGVDAALECVGTGQSMATAFSIARPGSTVGIAGVPHGVNIPFTETFFRNVGWQGGPAPARRYIPELLPDVLDGRIEPSRVFDYETGPDGVADAYAAMDERRAIKSLIRVRDVCAHDQHLDARRARPDRQSRGVAARLPRIGRAEELQLASQRTDGSLRPYITMCLVRAGDDLTSAPPTDRTVPGTDGPRPVATAGSAPVVSSDGRSGPGVGRPMVP